MKVVHLAVKAGGGAGIAARRTVEALRGQGIDAVLWTNSGEGASRSLRSRLWALWRARLASIPTRTHRQRRLFSVWSNAWLPSRLAPAIRAAKTDIVHLHWVGDGFLNLAELGRFGAPVVWTLHDAWAFTGGCHYPEGCRRYREACGKCPQLGSNRTTDISARNLISKRRASEAVSRWITPSQWLADLSKRGGVVQEDRLRVVPNGLNGEVFKPLACKELPSKLGLPKDAIILVAGAEDLREARKGTALLPEAVGLVQNALKRQCVLVVFGRNSGLVSGLPGVEVRATGELRTETEVAEVLAGADALLLPSLQDNFPNIAIEAQACGCPVVGFDTGGLREIIVPGQTGMLSAEVSAAGLAGATENWLRHAPARIETSARCRAQFESHFTYEQHAKQIRAVYEEVLR